MRKLSKGVKVSSKPKPKKISLPKKILMIILQFIVGAIALSLILTGLVLAGILLSYLLVKTNSVSFINFIMNIVYRIGIILALIFGCFLVGYNIFDYFKWRV